MLCQKGFSLIPCSYNVAHRPLTGWFDFPLKPPCKQPPTKSFIGSQARRDFMGFQGIIKGKGLQALVQILYHILDKTRNEVL